MQSLSGNLGLAVSNAPGAAHGVARAQPNEAPNRGARKLGTGAEPVRIIFLHFTLARYYHDSPFCVKTHYAGIFFVKN